MLIVVSGCQAHGEGGIFLAELDHEVLPDNLAQGMVIDCFELAQGGVVIVSGDTVDDVGIVASPGVALVLAGSWQALYESQSTLGICRGNLPGEACEDEVLLLLVLNGLGIGKCRPGVLACPALYHGVGEPSGMVVVDAFDKANGGLGLKVSPAREGDVHA